MPGELIIFVICGTVGLAAGAVTILSELWPPPQPFTCPRCFRATHRPKDRRYGYCGTCRDYTGTPTARARTDG